MSEPVRFVEHFISLEYLIVPSPVSRRFAHEMAAGRIVGHKCPQCGLVYVPPKGFCPLCCVMTGEEDQVEVADRGIVTSFTVVTPLQYHGQREKEPYVLANLLLDGADSTVGQQRIFGVPANEVRMGMRVRAVWAPFDRRADEGGGRGWGLTEAITHWVPTGEPDAPREQYQEHVL